MLNDALESEEFEILTDPKLGKKYVESEMICLVEVAAACVRHSSARRPRMGQVIIMKVKESLLLCYWMSNIYIYIYTNFQTLCSLNHHHICQVVRAFDGLAMCDLSNGMRVGDSTQQSAEIRLLRRMAFGYNSEFFSHTSLNE